MSIGNERDEFIGQLYEAYHDDLILFCRRHYHQAGVDDATGCAEETVQEVFMSAAKLYEKLMSHPNIAGWLYKTCIHKINNERKKFYRRGKRHGHAGGERNDAEAERRETINFADPHDLIQKYEDDEAYQDIKDRMYEALMESQRAAFTEYYIHGKKIKEIHEAAKVAEGTIKSQLKRIRDRLRKMGFDT